METSRIATLAERPESIAEWEELLLRLEIGPRALRNTLEEHPEEEWAREVLGELVASEATASAWLGSMRDAEPLGHPVSGPPQGSAEERLDRFASLRSRNFAAMQRRGLEVWEWSARAEDGTEVTAYQLLSELLRRDADALARLRGGTGV